MVPKMYPRRGWTQNIYIGKTFLSIKREKQTSQSASKSSQKTPHLSESPLPTKSYQITKSFQTTLYDSHHRKMRLLSLLPLLSALTLVLAATPTLPENPTPILFAPRQLKSKSSNNNCQNCSRRCETTYGKKFPHLPPPPGLCDCLKNCKTKTIPQPCLIVQDGCNL